MENGLKRRLVVENESWKTIDKVYGSLKSKWPIDD